MNPLELLKLMKKLNKDKYHTEIEMGFDENNLPCVTSWMVVSKNKTIDENTAILNSIDNTVEDIKELIERENNNVF